MRVTDQYMSVAANSRVRARIISCSLSAETVPTNEREPDGLSV